MATVQTVQKWGNSLGIRIPKAMAEEAGLTERTQVRCELVGDEIVIRKQRPRYTLAELVEGMSPDNAHAELDWGSPAGEEHW